MKKKKKLCARRFLKVLLYIGVIGYLGCSMINLSVIFAKTNEETAALNQKIQEQQAKQRRIEATKQEYNSDEYIEKIAREKLGFVKMNEIIFVDPSSK